MSFDKFPFTSGGNATDVGDLTVGRYHIRWSEFYLNWIGYSSGGYELGNVIDKFPFSTDGNATDVGDLTVSRYGARRSKFINSWLYFWSVANVGIQHIDKFSFTADGNATDVGDLVAGRYYSPVKVQQLMVILLGDTPVGTIVMTSFLSRLTLTQQMW